jgi:putative oxidoreductase
MFRTLVKTENHWLPMLMRIALGIVIFAHGAQKMLGWWGGGGFGPTMGFFTGMGFPAFLAFMAIAAEFFGGLGLILGFLGRIAALGVAINMFVAAVVVHAANGLFLDWQGTQGGHGIEFHLLALAVCLAVIRLGSGAASVDRAIYRRRYERVLRTAPREERPRRAA